MNVVLLAGDGRGLLEMVPLHAALRQSGLGVRLVYVGGPVDPRQRAGALRELGGPEPNRSIEVDDDTDAAAVAEAVEAFRAYLDEAAPDIVVAGGESDAVLACCLSAAKRDVSIARIDAGRRGGESAGREVNHVILDRLARHHFVSDPEAMANLLDEGISKESAVFTGNLLTDVFALLHDAERSERLLDIFNLKGQPYAAVLLERRRSRPDAALEVMQAVAEQIQVVHLAEQRDTETEAPLPVAPGVRTIDAESLREVLMLIERAQFVVTDAELAQEAAAYFEVPCLTVGRPVGRPVTVTSGCNRAVGFDPREVGRRVRELLDGHSDCSCPPHWDGEVSHRIVDVLVRGYGRRLAEWISTYFVEAHLARKKPVS